MNREYGNHERKRKRQMLLKARRFLGLLLILVGLFLFSYFFNVIDEVTVEGTDLYTDEEIKDFVLDDEYSTNTIYVWAKAKRFPDRDTPFISRYEVKITGMKSINIKAVEKQIIAYIPNSDGTYIYVNYDGTVADVSNRYLEGYVVLQGVNCENPIKGEKLVMGERGETLYLLALVKYMQKYRLNPLAIVYDDKGFVTLILDDCSVVLGESTFLDEKVSRIEKIRSQLNGAKGEIHMENYSLVNTDIIFVKAEDEEGTSENETPTVN